MSIYRRVVRLKRINALVLIGITSVFVSCISNNSFIVCNASMSFFKGQGLRLYSVSGFSLDHYYAEMRSFYTRPDADMWSQYAFHRVDDALEQWHTSPFARELDFAGFCENLLPYRIGTEEPEEWWTDYRATFGGVLDTLVARPGVTLAEFCDAVGKMLPEPHRSYTGYPSNKPSGKPSSLKKILGGTCEDYLGLTTYLCRSYGIPIAADYTPQWGNHSKGHQWSAIIQGDSTYHFMIGEPLFLAREKPFTFRLAKAYRRMTSPQRRYPGRGSRPGELPASGIHSKMDPILALLERGCVG